MATLGVWNLSPYDLSDGAGVTISSGSVGVQTVTPWLTRAVMAGLLTITDGSPAPALGPVAVPQTAPVTSTIAVTTSPNPTVGAGQRLPVDATAAIATPVLPPAAPNVVVDLVKVDASSHSVIPVPYGADTILPATYATLSAQGAAVRLFGTTGGWVAVLIAPMATNSATQDARTAATLTSIQAAAVTLAGAQSVTGEKTFTSPIHGSTATLSGSLSAASASLTGLLGAGSASISGALSAGSATIAGALGAQSASVTGALSAGSISTSGAATVGSLSSTGVVSATYGSFSNLVSAPFIDAGASGFYTTASSSFGAMSTGPITTTGSINASVSVGATLNVVAGGDVHGTNGVFTGTVTSNGTVLTSDERLKQNFTDIEPAVLDELLAAPVREWEFTGSDERRIGPTAQAVPAVLRSTRPGSHYLGIKAESLVGALLALAQRQHARLTDLTARLDALEGR
ncbi:tail fiber domain-containing protein [Actinomycetospora endophytica]|uniref:Tail fiber domain-containing protein n=1 Tax=Actinomycetospora endophytica TaxID=2291215 RepID=A0ABS8P5J1_9PSEU|nr:tail fiber domain-containing protein [Actinomycetospora endophytica]MCD2193514.1 tail fiber domain-containing protein [Actinomycetospora endophytica]